MNTLWTFGDSFTYGSGLRFPSSQYVKWDKLIDEGKEPRKYYLNYKYNYSCFRLYKVLGDSRDKVWPVRLAKKLEVLVKNLGICGISNDMIFDILIHNYNNIKEGDIVIVGTTGPERFGIVSPVKYNLSAVSVQSFPAYSDIYHKIAIRGNNIVSDNHRGITYKKYNELTMKKKQNLIFKLGQVGFTNPIGMLDFIEYRRHNLEILEKEAEDKFNFVLNRLEEKGVKTLMWSYTLWGEYERFMDTDLGFRDRHWSPNGNADFTNFLFEGLNNNEKYLQANVSQKLRSLTVTRALHPSGDMEGDNPFIDEDDSFIY